ncbi:MAG: chromosome segregation protein SMC [Candidatus Goldbacteria bacterium]|nr:chromosome segregation protein SMC [Candidatus Goldiibacteriota bacterium]
MKLKFLDILGFKSFADKTHIEFGDGITIIVGPNGAGKSNIVDAIRWVLGEQSAKSLRGSKMEDIIFNGSDAKKTLGMAEVSVTFDNQDKTINIPYNEIKVTRRLYRSGESEYLINDNPVRLKDIVELFMDTGVGIDAYSIISQGEVDRIINNKPLERREIFEEAAGITKYITKRNEALNKLQSTEQHMLRINDILSEVKRQAASLERQAKKAEKFRELKQECNEMEIKILKRNLNEKYKLYEENNRQKEEIEKKIHDENIKLSSIEKKVEELKIKASDLEKEIFSIKEVFLIDEQMIKRIEDSLQFNLEKKSEFISRIEDLKKQNVENVAKIEGLKTELKIKEENIIKKIDSIKIKEDEFNEHALNLEETQKKYEEKKKINEEKIDFLNKITQEFNVLKNNISVQETLIKGVEEKILLFERDKKEIEEKIKRLKIEFENISRERIVKEDEIRQIKDREEKLIKEKIKRQELLGYFEETIKYFSLNLNRLETKLTFLRNLYEQLAGYGEVVKKILFEFKAQLEDKEKENISGVVGNIVKVKSNYEQAVEKALKEVLQTVVVRDDIFIEEIFTLYEKEKGILNIIDLSSKVNYRHIINKWNNKIKHRKILAPLLSVMDIPEQFEIIKLFFANIFLVEDIKSAREVIEEINIEDEYKLLTLNGEIISNYGIYRKGEGEIQSGIGLLGRQRLIVEIESEVITSQQRLKAMMEERESQKKNIQEIDETIEKLSVIYHNQYIEIIKDGERIKQKEEEKEKLYITLEKIENEKMVLENQKNELITRRELYENERKKMSDEIDKLTSEIIALKDEINMIEQELNQRKSTLEEKRIEILKLKSDYNFEINQKEMILNRISEIQKNYDEILKEIEELNLKITQIDTESKDMENRKTTIKTELSIKENELKQKMAQFDAINTEIEKADFELKEMGGMREQLKEQEYDLKLKINELSMEIKSIYEKIENEFKISLTEDEINSTEITEEQYKELSMKVAEYKEKMEKLGFINLVAIEEYNDLKKREEFLQAQYDDLSKARDNLHKVIKKANEESKELFNKAFEEIRVRFTDVFKKMTNGGDADLVLTDSENILESGIDIIARPPGKRPQSITLLSGGEKAITAISLLFALFLIKASPFCIMDEVDAALDDINVVRFTNLIKGFKKTQFIIISHNKLTMEMADIIYGVSMEKAGVSQIISVKLDKALEMSGGSGYGQNRN